MATSIINSDDGVISGTSGLKTTGGNDGALNIQANGTTAIAISASGTVTMPAGALPVASGGTGSNTLTAESVVIGNGTSAVKFVAAGTNGNVLTSNGTAWVSQAISAGGDYIMQVFAGPGTWTKPAGLKAVKVTVVGGGGGGGAAQPANTGAGGGGGGGTAIEYLDAPAIPGPVSVTVGGGGAGRATPAGPHGQGSTGGTSSFGAFCSATGGTGGYSGGLEYISNAGGAGGVGSGGTFNLNGQGGGWGIFYLYDPPGVARTATSGQGGSSSLGAGGAPGYYNPSLPVTFVQGTTGGNYGGGGAGAAPPAGGVTSGLAGGGGVVIVEEFY